MIFCHLKLRIKTVKSQGLKTLFILVRLYILHVRKRKRKHAALPTEYKIKKGPVESNAPIN